MGELLSYVLTILGTMATAGGVVWKIWNNHLSHLEDRLNERMDRIEHRVERLEDKLL